jgi:multidrug resistance efflux pump
MKRIMTGTIAVVAVAVTAAWIARSQETANGAPAMPTSGPLLARGYTEAPAGTVMIASDPNGGSVLKELRIKDGQKVKRDEVIAVMGNYPSAEVNLKIAENNLLKTERFRDTTLKGTRLIDLKLEEDALKSSIESERLASILRSRSGKPAEEKELEVWLSEQRIKNQEASLALSKRRLQIELEQNATDIVRLKAAVDQALRLREESLVRSPIDGVVTQINSREGEMASGLGIAKVVDMKQLRVFATVDELHLPRLKVGSPVEVTFRGTPTVYKGKIAIAPMTVKREKRSDADLGVANVRQIEVEIQADDGVIFPAILGREARVTFL